MPRGRQTSNTAADDCHAFLVTTSGGSSSSSSSSSSGAGGTGLLLVGHGHTAMMMKMLMGKRVSNSDSERGRERERSSVSLHGSVGFRMCMSLRAFVCVHAPVYNVVSSFCWQWMAWIGSFCAVMFCCCRCCRRGRPSLSSVVGNQKVVGFSSFSVNLLVSFDCSRHKLTHGGCFLIHLLACSEVLFLADGMACLRM